MSQTIERRYRPIPASYLMTAALGSVVVLVCFATASWRPWFVDSMGWMSYGGDDVQVSRGLSGYSLLAGAGLASIPWIALRWPGLAISLALLPLLPWVLAGDPVHFGVFATLCAVTLAAGWRTPRTSLIAAAVAVTVIVVWLISGSRMAAPFGAEIDLRYGGPSWALGVVYAVAAGLVVLASWRLRVNAERDLERRGLVARADQVEEHSAVLAERSRLARDLHDVVAHHVSLIAVRAETAPYTQPGMDDGARGVLADIARDARLALDELRGVLGILGRAGDGDRAPQPTWQDIGALVERARAAGAVVISEGDAAGGGPEVGGASGYAAYRVVQEALTNARKHAPGRPVTVHLTNTGQVVVVRVSTPLRGDPAPDGTGHGLAGMRERVEALGGTLRAGPDADRFVVEATLPGAPG